jgi:predicted nucleotidyltransferase
MEKVLAKAEKIAGILSREFPTILKSITLFGSAARNEFQPGRSNLNILLLFTSISYAELKRLSVLQRRFGQKIALMCLTEEFLITSLDTFPLEILDIKLHHKILFGEDVWQNLKIPPQNLRQQCERELKAKCCLLEQAIISHGCKEKILAQLLLDHFPALCAIWQGIIYLYEGSVPQKRRELAVVITKKFSLSTDLFPSLLKLRNTSVIPRGKNLENMYSELIQSLKKFAQNLDKLEEKL